MPDKKRRENKGDWVVVGGKPGEIGYCTRCGDGLNINFPQPFELITEIMKAFVKIHSRCAPGRYVEKPPTTPDEWANGRDTGTSSLTIYSSITGQPSHHKRYDVPHDPADFGRCYRLLKLFPAWREKLPETVKICPEWEPFVEAWDELTALYEQELPTGTAPQLYDKIKLLERKARA